MELVFRGDRHATRGSDGAVTGDLGGARGVDWEHRAVLVPATFAAGRARLPGIAARRRS